ncbi:radical SAM protein [Caldicellulosiruptor changbaiensis]|uniref:Radical SAM protein n=1 Tax=Caldicellulosiruptor changbaiensis TaxID=1222016 RepID=A0A3T0D3S4_9FIRM|nr:radical SAM protein [Caldicellulosiruptor changbaiensis]AZT89313.1 radical SAM protein [Caldicellulosiruptor changbaiensis]
MGIYFKLYPHVYFIRNKNSACLYNTLNGDMISLKEPYISLLELSETNTDLQNINNNMDFYNQLYKLNLGAFYRQPVYVEKAMLGLGEPLRKVVPETHLIKELQIEITKECNFDCKFCIKEDNILFRKTGCKRWKNEGKALKLDEWKNIIEQASQMGCRTLTFFGGEPFIKYSVLYDLVKYAKNFSIANIKVFTNGALLTDEMLSFIKKENIELTIQILSFDENCFDKISGVNGAFKKVFRNLDKMLELGIQFNILFLVNKFNETELEYIKSFKTKIKREVVVDFIHPKPENNFYSTKYINYIYAKERRLIKPNLHTFMFLKNYNCCYGEKIAISENGDVFPCIMSRQLKLGNIREISKLYKIFNTDFYYFLKKLNKDKIEGCKECAYRYGCIDCRALEMAATNKLTGMEYCEFAKQLMGEV